MKSIVKDPNAIVRVKNNMPGPEAHFMYESQDGERKYHIACGRTGEMRWKDYLEIQQYERVRQWLSLADDTIFTDDGEIQLDGMNASEAIPLEQIHEILALPLSSLEVMMKTLKKPNLVRIKGVAEEQGREEAVELIAQAIKSRGGRPPSKDQLEE